MKYFLILGLFLIFHLPAVAFATLTPEQKQRADHLFRQIRCPVCAAQTIDGSDTDGANDMRNFVINKIEAGLSDEEIFNALRASYGDSVITAPPVNGATALLWLTPLAVLLIGLFIAAALIRRKETPGS